MKKTLNEEISRIKGMMGKIMNEEFDDFDTQIQPEELGDEPEQIQDEPSIDPNDIDWDEPSQRHLRRACDGENSGWTQIYGYGSDGNHYVASAPVISDEYGYVIDDTNITDIKIDDSWEPSDDQMMNYGNSEGGISYGGGDTWQGR